MILSSPERAAPCAISDAPQSTLPLRERTHTQFRAESFPSCQAIHNRSLRARAEGHAPKRAQSDSPQAAARNLEKVPPVCGNGLTNSELPYLDSQPREQGAAGARRGKRNELRPWGSRRSGLSKLRSRNIWNSDDRRLEQDTKRTSKTGTAVKYLGSQPREQGDGRLGGVGKAGAP